LNFYQELIWVHNALGMKRPRQAPSLGAQALLEWAREKPGQFYRLLYREWRSATETKDKPEPEEGQDGHMSFLEDLLRKYEKEEKPQQPSGALNGQAVPPAAIAPPPPVVPAKPPPPPALLPTPKAKPLCSDCQKNGPQPNCGGCYLAARDAAAAAGIPPPSLEFFYLTAVLEQATIGSIAPDPSAKGQVTCGGRSPGRRASPDPASRPPAASRPAANW
jgi:hypothetical protein